MRRMRAGRSGDEVTAAPDPDPDAAPDPAPKPDPDTAPTTDPPVPAVVETPGASPMLPRHAADAPIPSAIVVTALNPRKRRRMDGAVSVSPPPLPLLCTAFWGDAHATQDFLGTAPANACSRAPNTSNLFGDCFRLHGRMTTARGADLRSVATWPDTASTRGPHSCRARDAAGEEIFVVATIQCVLRLAWWTRPPSVPKGSAILRCGISKAPNNRAQGLLAGADGGFPDQARGARSEHLRLDGAFPGTAFRARMRHALIGTDDAGCSRCMRNVSHWVISNRLPFLC